MTTAILPEKHVRTSESLVGLGALVLSLLDGKPKSLDNLWRDLKHDRVVNYRLHGSITLDTVVLAVDFLFTIGAVRLTSEGLVEHASH